MGPLDNPDHLDEDARYLNDLQIPKPTRGEMADPTPNLLAAENLAVAEVIYEAYARDPASVAPEWRSYFDALDDAAPPRPAQSVAVAGPTPDAPRPPTPMATGTPAPLGSGGPLEQLAHIALFRDLGREDQALLAGIVRQVQLDAGDFLFRAGDPGDALFVVISGALRVERQGRVLATLGEGQVTGEMAVIDKKPRSADIVAHTDTVLLKLPAADFDNLLDSHGKVARGMLLVMADRLRRSNAQQEKVDALVRAYRTRGHRIARLDPLGRGATSHPELELDYHGLISADLDLPFSISFGHESQTLPLRDIVRRLRNTYCRAIGVQYMHIDSQRVRDWLQARMEATENHLRLDREEQLRIFTKLTDAEIFETFIHKKFLGAKRFSLEGAESVIPLLDLAIESAAGHGVEDMVIGMAHRGRLNVLANVMGKSPRRIFEEFKDQDAERHFGGGGDVKYHLGYSADRHCANGRTLHLSLCFNPSHLEFVGPVVLGRVRAKQHQRGDDERRQVLGLILHGDAAFAGQGVVQEMLNMSDLPGYDTGGTVHVIINNQVGFTTPPEQSRSSQYATDIARTLDTPIFHVNGEDPEGVAQAIALAMDFRAEFKRDIVIDMYCYRRHGHNEGDEPTFTQPIMYRWIKKQPPVRNGYLDNLLELGGVTREEAEAIAQKSQARLDEALERVGSGDEEEELEVSRSIWEGYVGGEDMAVPETETGVEASRLSKLLERLTNLPDDFHAHPKIGRMLGQRREMAAGKRPLDWSAGEALAFATLLTEGAHVRLSGQDSGRGTFSHRHAELHDHEDGHVHTPLQHLEEGQAPFSVYNSPLSEIAVLGFDWGYSLDTPGALVIWEAQFGDFANVAQVIVDQFISSAEQKWNRLSGLVLLLPHGFEGQGPEHSSARLERFLSMASQDNIQVITPTTPAQIYHALRRQIRRPWRKPLVVMAPKSMLRHPLATSRLDELASGCFQRVIDDPAAPPPGATRSIVLCGGKIFYDLAQARERLSVSDVALVRIEQLYPFPSQQLAELLEPYPASTELIWTQEEPINMGAWAFVRLAVPPAIWGGRSIGCVARSDAASPATGSAASHKREQELLVEQALESGN